MGTDGIANVLNGSPPRAWGQFDRAQQDELAGRFTPTRVGTILKKLLILLGPDLAARLDVFLQNQVASSATAAASHPSPAQSDIQQHLYQAIQKAEEAQQ